MSPEVLECPAPTSVPTVTQDGIFSSNPYPVLVVSITLLAAILRVHGIASKSFWMDEGLSVQLARLPWVQFLHMLWHREANMALYYVLLRSWLALGRSDGFVRGLSVLFSVGTVPVLYDLGRRMFDKRIGALAALLLATNAFHIRYAQEARSYALLVFLVTLAAWLLVRNIQEPASPSWTTFTTLCVLAVYSHFYAGLVILALSIALAIFPAREVTWRTLARQLAWFACCMLPIAAFVAKTGAGPISWLQPVGPATLLQFGVDLSGNYGRILLVLNLVAMGFGLVSIQRTLRTNGYTKEVWNYWFLCIWLFVPVTIVLTISLVRPLFLTRYFNACLPAMILLVASGIARIRPVAGRWLLGGAILACSVLGTLSYYQRDFDLSRQDWRAAASYISNHVKPGDSIFFYTDVTEPPFDFYYRWQTNRMPEWPKPLNPPYGTQNMSAGFSVVPGTNLYAARPVGDRVWLVFMLLDDPSGTPDMTGIKIRDWFAAGKHRIDVRRLYPIDIVLFAGDVPAPDQKASNVQ